MGNGVVIDPIIFKKEIDALVGLGVDVSETLAISRKAHLILPTHRLLDAASEAAKGKAKIGSTLKGIGPPTWTKLAATDCASETSKAATLNLAITRCETSTWPCSRNLKDSSTRSTTPSGWMPSPSCAG